VTAGGSDQAGGRPPSVDHHHVGCTRTAVLVRPRHRPVSGRPSSDRRAAVCALTRLYWRTGPAHGVPRTLIHFSVGCRPRSSSRRSLRSDRRW
jgi:hypothetical protein